MRTPATLPVWILIAVVAAGPGTPAAEIPNDRAAVEHALSRLTFGARPGEVERVHQGGLARWIETQLAPGEDSALASRLPPLPPKPAALDSPQEARRYGREAVQALAAAKIIRAVHSERQLEELLVDFWFNHFNVFAGKGRTALYIPEYERDAIRPHVFGTFRDLLGATAKSPAMLFYLDNWLSTDPNSALARRNPDGRRNGLNENYARELFELHTLGVDGGYTQDDIINAARAFTGWTIERPQQDWGFRFVPALHDHGEKTILGQRFPAQTVNPRQRRLPQGGLAEGERVLDLVAAHPSTATHIATKLARRFVSDEPPAGLVARVAARFTETDGDLRETVRAVITSPEFFADSARRAKVKTPLEFVASAMRASGREVMDARPLLRGLEQLGMAPYRAEPPTGYDDTADTWISAGALVARMNLARQLTPDQAARIGGPDFQRR
jgi:uncharacterized protein (DUF1800 family)